MRRKILALLMVVAMTMSIICPTNVFAVYGQKTDSKEQSINKDLDYVPGELIVTYSDKKTERDIQELIENTTCVDVVSDLNVLSENAVDKEVTACVSVDQDVDIQTAINQVSKLEDVESVQPNYIYKTCSSLELNSNSAMLSLGNNDAYEKNSEANYADVEIAVFDSRIDMDNSVLAPYIDKELAYNIVKGSKTFGTDNASHGTGVATTMVSSAKDTMSKTGVNYNLSLLPVQVVKEDYTTSAYLIEGCIYVKNMVITGRRKNIHIVNMSISGSPDYNNDKELQGCIETLREYGIITICAAGNSGDTSDMTPADFSNTIAVCSLDSEGNLNASSSWGPYKNVAAISNSTSGASAVVSGGAAVLYAIDPELTPEEATVAITSKDTTDSINNAKYADRLAYMDGIYQFSSVKAAKSVKKSVIEKPAPATEYIYNGSMITILEDTSYYTVSDGSYTDAGEYISTVSLKPGYIWSDQTRGDYVIKWKINPKITNEPEIADYVLTDSEDSGVHFMDGEGYTLQGDTQTNETDRDLSVTATLKPNYIWSDGSMEDKTYSYRITRANTICIPRTKSFVYDGETKIGVKASERYELSVNSSDENVLITDKGAVATNAGTYVVTVTPAMGYSWENAMEGEERKPVNVSFTISQKMIAANDGKIFKYSGKQVSVVSNPTYTTGDGILNETNEGDYTATLNLKDPVNTTWEDGSVDSKVVNWTIVPDIQYSVEPAGSKYAYITSWKGSKTDIVIPEEIDGYKVRGIKDYAFANSFHQVTSVVFPDNLWMIGNNAFVFCEDLKKISFAENTTPEFYWFGYNCFSNCTSLETVNLPTGFTGRNVILERATFAYCSALKSITITERFNEIGDSAFGWCTNLAKVNFVEGGSSDYFKVGNQSFAYCTSLQSIQLPTKTKTIGDQCFFHCLSLKNFVVPSKVYNLGNGCFNTCSSLESITFDNNQLASFTNLGDYLFYDCGALESINIPENVTGIGDYTFYKCTSLKTIHIPANVRLISLTSFAYTTGINKFTVDSSNSSFASGEKGELYERINGTKDYMLEYFPGGSSLASYTVPSDVKMVGPYVFAGNVTLKSITIPTTIPQTEWAGCRFQDMSKDLVISVGNKAYGDYISSRCYFDKTKAEINYPGKGGATPTPTPTPTPSPTPSAEDEIKVGQILTDNNTKGKYKVLTNSKSSMTVSYQGPSDNNVTSITVPEMVALKNKQYKVTAIASGAFAGNKKISKITIQAKISAVNKNMFKNCTSLKTLVIPASITSIGANAFYGCKKLESITIPAKVSNLGATMFSGCNKLKTITIKSKSLTAKRIEKNAFKGVNAKATVKVPKSKLGAYKKMFVKKGLPKKVKVKKE